MSYSAEQFLRDVRTVVNYNWESEYADYERAIFDGDISPGDESHIYVTLRRIDQFITPPCPNREGALVCCYEAGHEERSGMPCRFVEPDPEPDAPGRTGDNIEDGLQDPDWRTN